MEIKTKEIYLYWYKQYKVELKNGNIENWISSAKEKYSVSTQKIISASMKYFADMTFNINQRGDRYIHKISTINEEEFVLIYNSTIRDDFFKSERDRLILRILWETGMRIGELLNLKWNDISESYIKVIGKFGIGRVIPYKESLFNGPKKNSDYVISNKNGNKLSYSAVYKQFCRYKKILKKDSFSPHTLRHSFASRLIGKNIAIEFLSKIMGHLSINTTMVYIHFNEEKIGEFLNKI